MTPILVLEFLLGLIVGWNISAIYRKVQEKKMLEQSMTEMEEAATSLLSKLRAVQTEIHDQSITEDQSSKK